ncbi:hypothetical protein [Runella sp.]|uniref:hypothetical protein n=1 Tax=Runella sp. TaxID=1960881 RepID=UPI0030162665
MFNLGNAGAQCVHNFSLGCHPDDAGGRIRQAVEWVIPLRPWADPSLSLRRTTHGNIKRTYAEPMIGGRAVQHW